MITTLPITKTRINLGEIIRKVRLNKEYFIIEKDGYPVAGLMDIDEFEDYLDANDPKMKKKIRKSYGEYRAGKARPVEKILNELRASK
jgi:PHD/YefM family antitoxin component YafN of YafNO toxin-antitoxin module